MANRIVLNEISYHGSGAIQEIAGEVLARGFQKAFVCSDPDLIGFGVTGKVLKVLEEVDVKGISHITGGGFYENIPRSLKKGCCARIHKADVRTPALFHLMQKEGGISEHDMFNTFNMGVGMVLTVPAEQADKALEILHANGEPEAYRLGVIAEGEGVELC